MFRTSLLFVLTSLALAQTEFPLTIPPGGRIVTGASGTLSSGFEVCYQTVAVTPGSVEASISGGIVVENGVIHRYMADKKNGTYFGYDLALLSGNATTGYQVSLQPLSNVDFVLARMAKGAPPRPAPQPKYPPPQTVRPGDIIELDLMVSADGRYKMTDYIQIVGYGSEPPPAGVTGPPRDFTPDDGAIRFDIGKLAIFVNGQRDRRASMFTGGKGATFWFVIPGHGTYILSLAPHDGFVKAGAVRDNVIVFEDGGQSYEFRLMSPIVGEGGAFNLYMLHEPADRPMPSYMHVTGEIAPTSFIRGSVDRLENLLPK